MNSQSRLLGGALAAGALAYLFTTEKGKKIRKDIGTKATDFANELSTKTNEAKEDIYGKAQTVGAEAKSSTLNKIADFLIANRSTVMSVAGTLLPIVARRVLTRR